MRAVFLLFDTLVRKALEPYGGTTVRTPHFTRLAARTAAFDNHYVGSLPCMPARRDMHTGRLNFLHRSWGPLEPFDDSFPEILRAAGIYPHLVSDHFHYWEDGGATYHNRYATYEFVRGQESDPWKAMVQPPWERLRETYHALQFSDAARSKYRPYMINRDFIRAEADFPSVQCFKLGFEFLDRNRDADGWLLQVETFDPHEPFHAPERFRKDYPTNYAGPILDWPPYARMRELPDEAAELRANFAALVALCDEQLGKLIDYFDAHDMWKDTALIVGTDHGFLLGEHDWWAKVRMPCYQEVAHIPLFIHDPRRPAPGRRIQALTQTIDLMPTILDLFGLTPPAGVEGRSLLPLLAEDTPLRDALIFGHWGAGTNVTDGRHVYFRYPADTTAQEIYQYTVMPTHMTTPFTTEELSGAVLAAPFGFTKGVPLLKIPGHAKSPWKALAPGFYEDTQTVLYDLKSDPEQLNPIHDPATEQRMIAAMCRLMDANEAPPEAFTRLGLVAPPTARTRGAARPA